MNPKELLDKIYFHAKLLRYDTDPKQKVDRIQRINALAKVFITLNNNKQLIWDSSEEAQKVR